MKISIKYVVFILLTGSFWGWSQSLSPSGTAPSVSEIAATFTNHTQITKSVVFVNPDLAMRCSGATREQVEAARTKFGPHANAGILIYMNKLAADSFATNASAFPVGSVIVKQKKIHSYYLDENERLVREADAGVGGMIKRPPGYDAEHGDWEYFYFEDIKKIESGRIASCVQCHASAKDKDYVFGTWRKIDAAQPAQY